MVVRGEDGVVMVGGKKSCWHVNGTRAKSLLLLVSSIGDCVVGVGATTGERDNSSKLQLCMALSS